MGLVRREETLSEALAEGITHGEHASMSQEESPKPPRRTRGLFRGLLLLAAILGGASYYWINSPSFAVMQLEQAIKEKDLATFYSRLDLNRIYDSSIDALTVIKTEKTPESPWENVQNNIGAGLTKVLKSQVMNAVKHEIELGFRKDRSKPALASASASASSSSSSSSPSQPSPLQDFFGEVNGLTFARPVRSGEIALVNVEVHLEKMGKTYPVTLRLEQLGDWKVTGFEGLSSALDLYTNDQAQRVDEHNRHANQEMAERVPFFGQVRQEENILGLGKQIHFEFLIQNKGLSMLQQIDGTLVVLNSKNDELLKEPFHKSDLNLGVQEKKVFLVAKDIGIFTSKAVSADTLTLQFRYDRVRFKDGREIVKVKTYKDL